jgi:hypothetical protein
MSVGRQHKHVTPWALAAGALVAVATVSAAPSDASAAGPVTPTGKGIVGGALLGAEVVTIPMGAAGLNKGWPYFVFGGLGMVGGGVGGYFVEKATAVDGATGKGGPAEPALYMLAGGMALIIPALVLSLNATAYKPPDSDRNEPANNEPASDAPKPTPIPPAPGAAPGAPGAGPAPGSTASTTSKSAPASTKFRPYQYKSRFRGEMAGLPHIPTGLIDMFHGKLGLGLPAVEMKPLYTQAEMFKYGVAQGTEVKLPLFKAMF